MKSRSVGMARGIEAMLDLEPQKRSNCDTSDVRILLLPKIYEIYQQMIEEPGFIRTGVNTVSLALLHFSA